MMDFFKQFFLLFTTVSECIQFLFQFFFQSVVWVVEDDPIMWWSCLKSTMGATIKPAPKNAPRWAAKVIASCTFPLEPLSTPRLP